MIISTKRVPKNPNYFMPLVHDLVTYFFNKNLIYIEPHKKNFILFIFIIFGYALIWYVHLAPKYVTCI